MKILVTGANGLLGVELVKQLSHTEHMAVAKSKVELDIRNFYEVERLLNIEKFDVIINAAGFTNVDLCETEVEAAYKVNSLGARNVALAAEKIGAKVVYISTDYVFDGEYNDQYREYHEPIPKSVYGLSKLLGESFTKKLCSKHFIIRTSGLYGDGSNFVNNMLKLAKTQSELKIVNDQYFTPTNIKDLSKVIIALIETDFYGTYHGTNEGFCSWYDFATEIFKIKNIDVTVVPISTEEVNTAALRPAFSVLENYQFKVMGFPSFRHWKHALQDYLLKS